MIYCTKLKRCVPQVTALIDGVHWIGQVDPTNGRLRLMGLTNCGPHFCYKLQVDFLLVKMVSTQFCWYIDNRLTWVPFSFSILLFETYGLRTQVRGDKGYPSNIESGEHLTLNTFFELLLFLGFYWEKRIAFFYNFIIIMVHVHNILKLFLISS